jgi:hypothetical protein
MTSYEGSSRERLLNTDRMFGRRCLRNNEIEQDQENEGGCLNYLWNSIWYLPNQLLSWVSSPVSVQDGSDVLNARDDTGHVGKRSVYRVN